MSLANKISILRILLVPVFVTCMVYYRPGTLEWTLPAAFWIFILGMLTDAIDGYVARITRQATQLGAILDPVADKLFLGAAFLCLSFIPALPDSIRVSLWVSIFLVSRDLLIVAGWVLIAGSTGQRQVLPSRWGKASTLLQTAAVGLLLAGWPMARYILWVAVGLAFISGVGYLRQANRALNFKGAAR